jgi:hypothetical protein
LYVQYDGYYIQLLIHNKYAVRILVMHENLESS